MKQKQRIIFFGMVAVALILAACDGDSGNNSSETEGDSSSSGDIFWSSSLAVSSSNAKVESSSSVTLSSSTAKSSSSSVTAGVVDPSTVVSGTMTDSRDAQVYKMVTIGTQTWMAENLNYADSTAMPNLAGNSWCYENIADSCAKYGRLYTWTGAMNIASSYQSASASAVILTPQQGVCPAGWHIPTDDEWTTLETAVGGSSTAGTKLKSASGWYDSGNGTDAYGFSALPAGIRYISGSFYYAGSSAFFWSATEVDAYGAYVRYLSYGYAGMYSDNDKANAFSVRCVKD